MKSQQVIGMVICAAIACLVVWIARNTYWDDVTLPTSLRGDAARYPLYAAESLAQKLGAKTSREDTFASPATNDVIYLSDWTWDLGNTRRSRLERWVESGGRLIVDGSVYFQKEVFEQWSGIEFFTPDVSPKKESGGKVTKSATATIGNNPDLHPSWGIGSIALSWSAITTHGEGFAPGVLSPGRCAIGTACWLCAYPQAREA